jgi:hypothetical protein
MVATSIRVDQKGYAASMLCIFSLRRSGNQLQRDNGMEQRDLGLPCRLGKFRSVLDERVDVVTLVH